jgi:hypothetical protein
MTTALQWQELVLAEVGSAVEGGDELDILRPAIPGIWDAWAWKGLIFPGIQALYVKRTCIDILLGQARAKVNFSAGPLTVSENQKFTNLLKLREAIDADITKLEKQLAGSRGGAIGQMIQTSPVLPDVNQLDPNDRAYRGDPLVATTPVSNEGTTSVVP